MSKRAAPADATSPAGKASKTGAARPSAVETSEMGEFEDAFEDELEDDDDEEDDEVGGTQLLPLHYQQPPTSPGSPAKPARATRASPHKPTRLSDVWDEREEPFDIGEESDEEDGGGTV